VHAPSLTFRDPSWHRTVAAQGELRSRTRLGVSIYAPQCQFEPDRRCHRVDSANDKKYLPGPLSFALKRAGEADVNFDWFDPSVAGIAGRVDPWLITLPPGASYSVVVTIPKGFRHLFTSPAAIRIRLTTGAIRDVNSDMQGLQFIHVWSGTLTSDWIQFPASCQTH
jgi:hypothetical protein